MRQVALEQAIEFLSKSYPAAEYEDQTNSGLTRAFLKGCIPICDEQGGIISLRLVPDDDRSNLDFLLEEAKTCPYAFDAVCAWIDGHLLNSGSIPKDATAFRAAKLVAAHRLGRDLRPAKKPGRPPETQHGMRHAVLRLAVAQVERLGFKPCSNAERTHNSSACDIVAEAMSTLGFIPQSSKRIEAIVRTGDRVEFID